MKLFDAQITSPIYLEKNADEAVRLAAQDLKRDLLRLSGKKEGFPISFAKGEETGIFIYTEEGDTPEKFTLKITEKSIVITGSDVLGTVYGIYAVSTRYLKILPTFRFIDIFPEEKKSLELESETFTSPERPVRFRGWFINDEDLLSEVRYSGHKRNLDYRYYHHIMAPEVMEMVVETALRLEYNLIIPATLMNIDNPAEEKLVEAAYRRGLYLSQHHIEPMGVSHFSAEAYLASRGRNDDLSFASCRQTMEEIWRYYAKKWAKYADRVVWQLGLRGKKDEAVWKNDPAVPTTWEGRGALVADAIQTQHNIICETLGHDRFHSTATLWNEGSMLYGKGFLTLPKGTVPVFADFGIDQMFGDDLFTTKQEKDRNYGVYYHVSFWALGSHLTEGCRPEKMAYSYGVAAEKNFLYYSMLNVSNVRPLHFSISMNSKILADPSSLDVQEEIHRFDEAIFGKDADEVGRLRRAYYDAFADFGEELAASFAEQWFFFYHRYPELPFIRNAATDGQLTWLGKYALLEKLHCNIDFSSRERFGPLRESLSKLEPLLKEMEDFRKKLTPEVGLYFDQFLHYQTKHMFYLTRWCMACVEMADHSLDTETRKEFGKIAIENLERILEERKVLENGEWEHWHRGDEKMNLPLRLEETRAYLNTL